MNASSFASRSPAQPIRRRQACARTIIENLARRAFRRPVTKDEVDSLMPYFEAGRKGSGGFDAGIEQAVAAVLVDPDFLYRTIRTPASPSKPAIAARSR